MHIQPGSVSKGGAIQLEVISLEMTPQGRKGLRKDGKDSNRCYEREKAVKNEQKGTKDSERQAREEVAINKIKLYLKM